MADYTVKRIDDMERTFGGGFVLCRAALGVKSFGLQVLDIPPVDAWLQELGHSPG